MSIQLHEKAFALRPVRVDVKNNRFIYYTGTTFPNGPRNGCEMYLRRAAICGDVIEDGDSLLRVDVLSEDGDVLQEFGVERGCFEYLRRTLRFCVDVGEAVDAPADGGKEKDHAKLSRDI